MLWRKLICICPGPHTHATLHVHDLLVQVFKSIRHIFQQQQSEYIVLVFCGVDVLRNLSAAAQRICSKGLGAEGLSFFDLAIIR
jgi:hypothetical protein